MHIGLIGGVGPAATEVYYRALIGTYRTAGRDLHLTIANGEIRDLIANLEAHRPAEQAAIFSALIDQLRGAGCAAAAITSIGGHFCLDELQKRSSLPLISAIDALATYFSERGVRRVGVLGTRVVMESGLYGINTAEIIAPPADELAAAHAAYMEIAAAGTATKSHRTLFHGLARYLYDHQGAEIVVLGGTDLSVAFKGVDLGFPVVDGAIVHADAIAARGLCE